MTTEIQPKPTGSGGALRYEQARETVEAFIRDRNLQPGDRLPTEEALRREFGWSRLTIMRALNELAWAGRVRRVRGSGTYIAEPVAPNKTMRDASTPLGENTSPASSPVRLLVSSQPYSDEDHYCAPLYAGIREEAAAQNIDIVYHSGDTVADLQTVQRLETQGTVALAWKMDDLPRVIALHEAGVPVVGLAHRNRSLRLPLVCADNYEGLCHIVRRLADVGHERIAYHTVNAHNNDIFERLSGYQFQMAREGLPVDPMYMQVSHTMRTVSVLEAWWNSLSPRPTALIIDGVAAVAMLTALRQQKVRIPDDLSVVIVDEIQALRMHEPPLAFLRQPTYAMGRRALHKLAALVRGDESESGQDVLPTELVDGESIAPPPSHLSD